MKVGFVLPGEMVAVAEEAIPQQGVYMDERGFIRAQFAGVAVLDKYRKVVSVKPFARREFSLKAGMLAEGVVAIVVEDMAIVKLYSADSGKILGAVGLLHISQISSDYISDMYEYLKPSDIVRVRVLNSSPPYLVSTKEPSTGVILAWCSNCGRELYLQSGDSLVCSSCGSREKRKVAVGYMLIQR